MSTVLIGGENPQKYFTVCLFLKGSRSFIYNSLHQKGYTVYVISNIQHCLVYSDVTHMANLTFCDAVVPKDYNLVTFLSHHAGQQAFLRL